MRESEVVAEVWREHAQHLLACCRWWTGGNADKAQEAFSRVWERVLVHYPRQRAGISDVRRWLERVTYHACMDTHREMRARAEESLESGWPALIASNEPDPERMLIGRERLQFMEAAYGQLPERLQEALQSYLRYGSYREIAHHLGISEENGRKRIQEARAILRRRLAEYDANRVRSVHLPPRRAVALPAPASSTVVRAVTRRLAEQKNERVSVTLTAAAPAADARRRNILQEYVARHPSGWKRHLDLARVLIELDVPEAAALHYRAAALRKPARGDIWIDAMSLCVALHRMVDAAVLRDLVMESPLPEGERALLAGLAAVTLGNVARARAHFEIARQLAERAPRPRVELARLSLAEGAVSDALALLDEALGLAPDDIAALTTGLVALRAAGRNEDAIERARRALAIDPLTPIPD